MVLNKEQWQNEIRGIKVEGSSMKPLFNAGDMVLVKKVADEKIRKGDCVVYNFDGANLLHRIIKIAPNGVWICDDGEVMSLHFAKWDDIRGRVESKNPLKNGFTGFIYFNLKKICRNTLRLMRQQWTSLLENPEKP